MEFGDLHRRIHSVEDKHCAKLINCSIKWWEECTRLEEVKRLPFNSGLNYHFYVYVGCFYTRTGKMEKCGFVAKEI